MRQFARLPPGPRPSNAPAGLRPRAAPEAQRDCSCGGGCPRCSLPTSRPGDAVERTAQARADAVLRAGPLPQPGPAAVADGAALPPALRAGFEARFGHDFGAVRLHTGPGAQRDAAALRAHAFTAGHDIVFGAGRYAPHTPAGQRLLAHELAHVEQQPGVVAGDFWSTVEAELQIEEELRRKAWSSSYGRNPVRQYSDLRGAIGEDVRWTDNAGKKHERHIWEMTDASAITGRGGRQGTAMDMTHTLEDDEVATVMVDPGAEAQVQQATRNAAQGAGARLSESFRLLGLDTLEAQALYMAHAAVESEGLRTMDAQADPPDVGDFKGRGPLQVTYQQGYVQALVYLDEQAARMAGSGQAAEAARLRAVSAAVKADPAAASLPENAYIFSAAMMRGAGGVHAAAEMAGRTPVFGGNGPEDRWESGGENFAARIAEWQGKKAQGVAGAQQRLDYWQGLQTAGQRKARAYARALEVLKPYRRQP